MELNTIRQTYILPASSQLLNSALATLATLGLQYEGPRELRQAGDNLLFLVVIMPTIPVVHLFDLLESRQDIVDKARQRAARPSHVEAKGWIYGPLADAYTDAFFSQAVQIELTHAVADLVVREHILRHFKPQGICIQKIILSKPTDQVLNAPRSFRNEEWYALVEEARPIVPDLAELLGAIQ